MKRFAYSDQAEYVLGVILFLIINFLIIKLVPLLPFENSELVIYFILVSVNTISLYILHKFNRLVGIGYLMAIPAAGLFIAIIIVELIIHPPTE